MKTDTEPPNTETEANGGAVSNSKNGVVTPIPEVYPMGFLSEHFLICGKDGVVKVKDGRTLEEYINDPRLVDRRKGSQMLPSEMALCSKIVFERGVIGQCA